MWIDDRRRRRRRPDCGRSQSGRADLALAQEELRFQLARPSYDTWLATATLVDSDGQRFLIGVPTRLARDWVSERFVSVIQEVLSGASRA